MSLFIICFFFFFFNDTATTEIYTLSLHDALPISGPAPSRSCTLRRSNRLNTGRRRGRARRSGADPEFSSYPDGIDSKFRPPPRFVPGAVEVAVVNATERDRELVAHLAAERAGLGEAQVVGIAGSSPAE